MFQGLMILFMKCLDYNMKGVSKRSAFVIDKDGIVRYAEVLENAGEVPDFEAIQAGSDRLELSFS